MKHQDNTNDKSAMKEDDEEEKEEESDEEEKMDEFVMEGALDRSAQSEVSGGQPPSAACILALTAERSSELMAVRRVADQLTRQDLEAKKKSAGTSTSSSSPSLPSPTSPSSSSVAKTDRPMSVSSDHYTLAAATTSMGSPPSQHTSTTSGGGSSSSVPRPTSQPGAFRSGGTTTSAGPRVSLTGSQLINEILQIRNSEATAAEGGGDPRSDGNVVDLEGGGGSPSHSENPAQQQLTNNITTIPNQQQQHQEQEEFIVEATLVSTGISQQQLLALTPQPPPTESAVYSEAHALDENDIATSFFRTKRGRRMACCICFIIMFLVVGMTLAVVSVGVSSSQDREKDKEATAVSPPNNNKPTVTTNSSVLEVMSRGGDENAIKAQKWLEADPNLEDLSTQEIKQRFVLMTLFFSTVGLDWKDHKGWMQYRADECSWYMGKFSHLEEEGLSDSSISSGGNNDRSCNDDGVILRINLDSNLLNGTIPPALALLEDDIQFISLANNLLQAGAPTELGALSKLQVLDLHNNKKLGGPLPSEFGNLSALRYLDVSRTQLTGNIQSELALNQELMHLNLKKNLLAGSIPPQLFELPALRLLDISSNQITGVLPSEVGLSLTLKDLSLSHNQMDGIFPLELRELSLLNSLDLASNLLRGPLPSELGLMSSLSLLDVGSNKMTGVLPTELGQLTTLCRVDVSDNGFSGTIPPEMGANCHGMPGTQVMNYTQPLFIRGILRVKSNARNQTAGIMSTVNDTFAASVLDKMTAYSDTLQSFSVEATGVDIREKIIEMPILISAKFFLGTTGRIPTRKEFEDHLITTRGEFPYTWLEEGIDGETRSETEIIRFTLQGSLPMLLDVSSNSISGPIPETLFGPGSMLQQLYAGSNQIGGSIPVSAGYSPELVIMDLSNNQIGGGLPSELGLLTKLATVDLSKNEISGSIPLELWKVPSLRRLDLSNNRINGSIPSLGSSISTLNLSQNKLSNALPSELGLLQSLCDADLSYNAFSGSVPKELGKLCLRGISEEETSSVAVAHTLKFGFAPDYPVRMPTIDEIGVWLHLDATHYINVLSKVFTDFEKVDLVYVGGSLDRNNKEYPLSFDMVVGVHYKPGSIIPSHDDYIDQLFDENSFNDYIRDYMIPVNLDPFMGVRQVDFYISDDVSATKPPIHLDLSFNNLTGTIPAELAFLYAPGSSLNLLGNNFTGSLPDELCPWHCASDQVGNDQWVRGRLSVDCQQVSCQCDCS